MSDPERYETIKRLSPKVKNSEAHRSDIPPTKKALAKTPDAHLSTVGKEGEGVKGGLDNLSRFRDALGTEDREAGFLLLSQAVLAMPHFGMNGKLQDYVASTMAILRSIGPRDNLEGVLAVQMTAVHNLAMEFLLQASRSDGISEVVEANVNRANKLLRTFTAQMEALNRRRGNISQEMAVGSVNVSDGGQAIVGPVNYPGPRKVSIENDDKKAG